MSVSFKPYIIFEIEEIKKAELNVMGMKLHAKPDLDMYRIKAVLKSYIEKTQKGFEILDKLGHGDKLDQLNKEYLDTCEAFTAYIPITSKSININNYHLGGEIMIAYYPTDVYATWHMDGQPDNHDDHKRHQQMKEEKKDE